jgi:hypothetical protein
MLSSFSALAALLIELWFNIPLDHQWLLLRRFLHLLQSAHPQLNQQLQPALAVMIDQL